MTRLGDPKDPAPNPTSQEGFSREEAKKARIRARSEDSELLGLALAGRPVQLMQLEDGPALVNLETGEVVDHAAGAGMVDRMAVLCLMAGAGGNSWSGDAASEGELWPAGGHLWVPPMRLDPTNLSAMRGKARRRARAGVERAEASLTQAERDERSLGLRQRARKGQRAPYLAWSFITLTHPHAGRLDDVAEIEMENRALSLLRKRKWWQETIRGGIKAIENKRSWKGPHVHTHLLVLARFVDQVRLKSEWASCLEQAMQDTYGEKIEVESSTLNLWVSQVRPYSRKVRDAGRVAAAHREGEPVSLEEAIQEVLKYCTKAEDLFTRPRDGEMPEINVAREDLERLALVERWPRMFELWGAAREPRVAKLDREDAAAVAWESEMQRWANAIARQEGLQNATKGLLAMAQLPGDAWLGPEGGEGSLDTACLSDGDPFGEGLWEGVRTLEWSKITLERPPKPPRGRVRGTKIRPLTIREAMRVLSMRDWLRMLMKRIEKAHVITLDRLRKRGVMVTSWQSGIMPVSWRSSDVLLDDSPARRIVTFDAAVQPNLFQV